MKTNILNITMSLAGWPAAATCGLGIWVGGGTIVFLGLKLIDNGYQLTSTNGVRVTSHNCSSSADEDVTQDVIRMEPDVA